MNKLKTIGISCLISSAVGVILICWVFPFVLALVLAATLPLASLITDGIVLFWALSFLQMAVLSILYVSALLLLLKCFYNNRLTALFLAFSTSICLLLIRYPFNFPGLLILELAIEIFLIVAVSLLIVWVKAKQSEKKND